MCKSFNTNKLEKAVGFEMLKRENCVEESMLVFLLGEKSRRVSRVERWIAPDQREPARKSNFDKRLNLSKV